MKKKDKKETQETAPPENATEEQKPDTAQDTPEENNDPQSDLLKQLDEAQAEIARLKDDALRGRADLENFRKRVAREKDDLRKFATATLIEELLPVLDNFKLGLQSAHNHPEAKVVTEGFDMVWTQLQNILGQNGLEELNPQGEAFDPNLHDCVSHQPSEDVPAEHVMQVMRAGYRLNERLVRPASVVVSSGKANDEQSTSEPAPEGEPAANKDN